jgi:mRNA-degrading endonuclease RelE of RelBE toxin-antitoxin system
VSVTVRITKSFRTAAKPLLKKYPSLSADLLKLEKELLQNPKQGIALGHNAYKLRLKISSKGKGKSGRKSDFTCGDYSHWRNSAN